MKAVVFKGIGKINVEEIPKPTIQTSTDAIVRVTSTTICRSDIKILHGKVRGVEHKPGLILGHECVGVVDEVGSEVKKVKPGDRVIVSNNVQCGTCYYCLQGRFSHCENGGWCYGNILNGTHAEFLRVPFADMGLHKIPAGFEDEDVLAVADILSTATYAAELAEVSPGDYVAIFGAGPVGLCTTAMCKTSGAGKIFAVDVAENRLSMAKELGADVLINPKTEPPVPKIKNETDGRGVDAAIEAVGNRETLQYALEAVRGCGRVAIIGIFSEPQTVPVDLVQLKSLTVRSGYVDTNRIPQLLRLVQQRKINTRRLFTHAFPLSNALKAYELFDKGLDGVIKVIIKP